MLVVMTLGGNALLRRDEPLEADTQRRNVATAARAVAAVVRKHDAVVTHGNGPQVGLLALQSESYRAVSPYPLDVLNAESEGMIGYLLQQAVGRQKSLRRPDQINFCPPTAPRLAFGRCSGAISGARYRVTTVFEKPNGFCGLFSPFSTFL